MQSFSETDLAKAVIAWLENQHWDVYQEVCMSYGGNVADIVAVQDGRIWVVETKTSLSLAVIEQAYEWQHYANWVSCAVPYASTTRRKGRAFAMAVMRRFGIGLIQVSRDFRSEVQGVSVSEEPKLQRRALSKPLLKCLCPEHKSYAAAGTNKGSHWSPFQSTCRELREYVMRNPGCTLKSVIEDIGHHYGTNKTARACMAKWIWAGKVRGIKWLDDDPRKGLVYMASTGADDE